MSQMNVASSINKGALKVAPRSISVVRRSRNSRSAALADEDGTRDKGDDISARWRVPDSERNTPDVRGGNSDPTTIPSKRPLSSNANTLRAVDRNQRQDHALSTPPFNRNLGDNVTIPPDTFPTIRDTKDDDSGRPTVRSHTLTQTQPETTTETRQKRVPGQSRANKRHRVCDHDQLENLELDVRETRMIDLCKDLQRGQQSSKHKEFLALGSARRKRATTVEAHSPPGSQIVSDDNGHSSHLESSDRAIDAQIRSAPGMENRTTGAPQVRVVDGKIVLDVASLQVDRTQRDGDSSQMIEYVDENPLDRRVNSRTHSRHVSTSKWDQLSCELFYRGLSQWGTDFEIISKMFPSRTRRQIKNKFSVEERRNPLRIAQALRRRTKMDLDEFTRHAGVLLRTVPELEADLSSLREQYTNERQEALLHRQEEPPDQSTHLASSTVRPGYTMSIRKQRRGGTELDVEVVGTIDEVEAHEREQARIAAIEAEDA